MAQHFEKKLALFESKTTKEDIDKSKTSSNCLIKLFMGPYEANGIIRHRTQRLRGLQDCLTKCGYNVELIPTAHLDRFTIEFYDCEIFRCNIKSLQFNLPCEEDSICSEIMQIVKEHEKRFTNDENVPRYVNVKYGMKFVENIKHLTTSDMLSGNGIELMFEINKQQDPVIEPPLSIYIDDQNSSVDLVIDLFKDISLPTFKAASEVELPNIPVPKPLGRVSITANAFALKSLRADFDEDYGLPDQDIWHRTEEHTRQRRAKSIFKSTQIKSVETSTSLTSVLNPKSRPSRTSRYFLNTSENKMPMKSSFASSKSGNIREQFDRKDSKKATFLTIPNVEKQR